MKLTGVLKQKVDEAETMETKKDIIADAGMELTDDELEKVAGGAGGTSSVKHYCDSCKKDTLFSLYSGGRAICSVCNKQIML